MRHTHASFSIAAGVSLFSLSRRMGTSVEMLDRVFGHLLPDAAEHERGLLDAFGNYDAADAAEGSSAGLGRGKAKKDTVAVCLPKKEERAYRAILVPEPHNN